jgi:quercetin dioxygenase-like cupin family protein
MGSSPHRMTSRREEMQMIEIHQKTQDRAPQWHMGSRFVWHATGADTGGAYALAEIDVRAGAEPPPHVHAHEEESYYVLEGTIDFFIDGEVRTARAGDFVILPRGHTHAFIVQSERARALLCITPAGLEEAFLATSEAEPPSGPPPREAIERVLAIHGERGIRFELGGAR